MASSHWNPFRRKTKHQDDDRQGAGKGSALPTLGDASCRIRLLKLPISVPLLGHLKLECTTVDISSAPAYNAISYTWGCPFDRGHPQAPDFEGPKSNVAVDINGERKVIKRNLHLALLQLTRRFPGAYLWNDATCIDQDDIAEKDTQMALMGSIYEKAESVLVWMGPDDRDTHLVGELYDKIAGPICERMTQEQVNSIELPVEVMQYHPGQIEFWEWLGLEPFNTTMEHWRAFGRFLMRTWFSRMWCVQELALASNAVIICGSLTLPATQASVFHYCSVLPVWAAAWMVLIPWAEGSGSSLVMATAKSAAYNFGTRKIVHTENKVTAKYLESVCGRVNVGSYAWYLLQAAGGKSATEPKDIVYSLLGLLSRVGNSHQNVSELLDMISYDMELPEIYARFGANLIVGLPCPIALGMSGAEPDEMLDPMPRTWIPHWRLRRPQAFANETLDSDKKPLFDAVKLDTDSQEAFAYTRTFHEKEMKMTLKGIRVDTIAETRSWLEDQDWTALIAPLEAGLDLYESMVDRGKLPGLALDCLWRTFILNTANEANPAPPEWEEHFVAHVEWFLNSMDRSLVKAESGKQPVSDPRALRTAKLMLPRLREKVRRLLPREGRALEPYRFDVDLNDVYADFKGLVSQSYQKTVSPFLSNWRRDRTMLCRTKQLNTLGRVFLQAEVGDEIWLIEGSRVPFVLRPSKTDHGCHQIYGEAYVHGIMNGELFDMPGFEGSGWQEVCLV